MWPLFGLGIRITVAALHWPGKSAEIHILFSISFRIFSVSSGRCFNKFLNERCESHHSPRNFVDSSTDRSVFPILTMGGLWARDRGAVKCMTLHLWAANLKPFLVAHSSMAFTACCRCLFMVSRERPRKQIARSSTKSALKMSLAKQEGSSLIVSPKHVTARTPSVGTHSSG